MHAALGDREQKPWLKKQSLVGNLCIYPGNSSVSVSFFLLEYGTGLAVGNRIGRKSGVDPANPDTKYSVMY